MGKSQKGYSEEQEQLGHKTNKQVDIIKEFSDKSSQKIADGLLSKPEFDKFNLEGYERLIAKLSEEDKKTFDKINQKYSNLSDKLKEAFIFYHQNEIKKLLKKFEGFISKDDKKETVEGEKIMKRNYRVEGLKRKINGKDGTEIFEDQNGVKYKEAETGDIWEYVECEKVPGEIVGEQLFSWNAIERELKKPENKGFKLVSFKMWGKILKEKYGIYYKGEINEKYKERYGQFLKDCNISFCGYRSTNAYFDIVGRWCYYWSPDEDGDDAWYTDFGSDGWVVGQNDWRCGFSLRFQKD